MNEAKTYRSRYSQFGLRTLFALLTTIAILIVVSIKIYDWYTSVPISVALSNFNSANASGLLEANQSILTESELVTAIDTQIPELDASEQVKSIYNRIAKSRRIPRGANLDLFPVIDSNTDKKPRLWCINLEIRMGPQSGYALRIRETKPVQ